ncbi:unnamed protein product, partial [Sphacelaria rigidula]
ASHIPNKSTNNVARILIDRVFTTFTIPEKLLSDQGREFKNRRFRPHERPILAAVKTRTTPFRPQGDSVPERVHSNLHAMLTMRSSVEQDNWASLLPFVLMAYNTSFNTLVQETPYILMFGRQPKFPVDFILGISEKGHPVDAEEYAKETKDNLQ